MGWFNTVKGDIQSVRDRDPAAPNSLEILLCYPGLHALWMHRIAHRLFKRGLRTFPRIINRFSHFLTSIDIHPGARIGEGFFIDHGTGVVIGETAEIGRNVTLFQGVSLGGTGKDTGKRHPTVRDNVVISAGASVLGPIEIGRNSKVGAGSVVISPVPENTTVVGVPGRIVRMNGRKTPVIDLHHERLPDPVAEALERLVHRLDRLEYRMKSLEKKGTRKPRD
ncbi:MAG: serine O-acetyltransferase [Candidatus Aenigmarchaeota archaeon]|nr:serine O-acetyltransferase [Candidatus Aenigmarchaeota archaeon]